MASQRRFTGEGPAAGLSVINRGIGLQIQRQLNEQDEERKFRSHIRQLGLLQGIKMGTIDPSSLQPISQSEDQRGLTPSFTSNLPEGMTEDVVITRKHPGGVTEQHRFSHGKSKSEKSPKSPGLLTPSQSTKIFSTSQPGRPMPQSVLPGLLGPKGTATENAAIQQGIGESPAAQRLPGQGLMSRIGGFMSGLMPRPHQVGGDPILTRIRELQAKGVPNETIAQHLREKGRDPSQYGL